MTIIEETLYNGVRFSIPRLVPFSVQEGEQENALYYADVLLTPTLDKLVIKIWEAPNFEPLIWGEKGAIESILYDVKRIDIEQREDLSCYEYGMSSWGYGILRFHRDTSGNQFYIHGNSGRAYDGLMLYPAIKCILVELIKSINKCNHDK